QSSTTLLISSHRAHRNLHSFPTRRSSDLSSVQERTRHKTKARRRKLVFAEQTWTSGANSKVHSKRDYSLSSGLPESKMPKIRIRSEEHTSELQSLAYLVCRLLLEKTKI